MVGCVGIWGLLGIVWLTILVIFDNVCFLYEDVYMSLTTFDFNGLQLRTITDENGEPWFVAADVCAVLGHSNPSKAVADHVDDDDKSNQSLGLPGKSPVVVNESGMYALIFGSRLESAKRFKKWVTREVLPSIRKTGGYSVPQPQPTKISFNEAAAGLDIIYRSLNVSETGKLCLFRGLAEDYGVSTNRLPSYAVDAPTVTAGSSEPTISITEILKRGGMDISPVMANKKLESLGMIRKEYRTSTRGNGVKNFWSITSEGLKYGKNVVSDRNQAETQPHWYVSTMDDLIGLLSE